jgi:transposase
MRKSFHGLSALVRQALHEDPLDGAMYVFVNRRRTLLKALYFESDGYCLWSKQLERGRFQVRLDGEAKQRLQRGEWQCIIEGIDLRSVRRLKRYELPLRDRRSMA